MDRVKVGIIRTGGIFYGWGGYSGHLPAYPQIEEAKLVALCDVNESSLKKALYWTKKTFEEEIKKAEEEGDVERAKRLREDIGEIRIYTDHRKMFKEESLTLIDIITPACYHAPLAIEALEKGINVMGEKPMARSWLECCQMIEAVEKSGKFYQYNENFVYASLWYNIKKLIDAKTKGFLDMNQLNSPLIVQSMNGINQFTEDNEPIATKEGLVDKWTENMRKGQKCRVSVGFSHSEGQRNKLIHFIECVQNDREPLVSGEDGKRDLEIAIAAHLSIDSRKPVELPL